MIAPAITRMLKLDPPIRVIAGVVDAAAVGGVSVADTKYSVPNTVTQLCKRLAKSRKLISRAALVRSYRCEFVPSCSRLLEETLEPPLSSLDLALVLSSTKLH
jgi:hypothetical protein